MMNEDLHVKIPVMDEKHDEFLTLLKNIQSCEKNEFLPLFKEMIEHTKEHFAFEEELMNKHEFYAKQEHFDEHKTLLGEMEYFYEKAQKLPMFGKSYINDYAYDKFKRHIVNIDSQLAMFLKEKNIFIK
ncbi:hemerythrin family protein [Sulfurimonas sp. HSL3-2]|uniref:bacteriohemerythrin n=1 Tax=Hydrocurvibacter mobilis TaxID=3131936 RepID=UPI0031F9628B